jgi:hypothetical protein
MSERFDLSNDANVHFLAQEIRVLEALRPGVEAMIDTGLMGLTGKFTVDVRGGLPWRVYASPVVIEARGKLHEKIKRDFDLDRIRAEAEVAHGDVDCVPEVE